MSHRAFDGYVTANTAASGTGATTTIRAQSATGATSTGGRLTLSSGSGTSADGYITLQSGGVTKLNVYATASQTFLEFAETALAPRLTQVPTASATGANLTIGAQSGGTQGGRIILQPGGGVTGGTIRMTDGVTGNNSIEFTPLSAGNATIAFVSTVTQPTYQQSATTTTNGATMVFSAQSTSFDTGTGGSMQFNAGSGTGSTTGIGGNVFMSAGTGTTTNGSVSFRVGTTTFLTFGPNPNPTGAVDMNWVSTITAPRIIQANNNTASATGADFTVQAQTCTGTTSIGGNLKLRSGTGTSTDGYVSMFGGATEIHRFFGGKDIYLGGQRVKLTNVATSPYAVLATDMNIMVDTTAARTINLPATPVAGDAYRIKDSTGTAATNNITVQGNGNNIEGSASNVINTNFGRIHVVYNGTQWVLF